MLSNFIDKTRYHSIIIIDPKSIGIKKAPYLGAVFIDYIKNN